MQNFDQNFSMESCQPLLACALICLVISMPSSCCLHQSSVFQLEQLVEAEIHGYHFHTYFFQTNPEITAEALAFRETIQQQIDSGFLANCRLNRVNMGPVGPHPIGSYETCCNKTSISTALTWFMKNHGNLSVLLHPLTRYEVLDHTHRAMFLGKQLPLDVSVLSEDLVDNVDLCLPIPSTKKAEENSANGAGSEEMHIHSNSV